MGVKVCPEYVSVEGCIEVIMKTCKWRSKTICANYCARSLNHFFDGYVGSLFYYSLKFTSFRNPERVLLNSRGFVHEVWSVKVVPQCPQLVSAETPESHHGANHNAASGDQRRLVSKSLLWFIVLIINAAHDFPIKPPVRTSQALDTAAAIETSVALHCSPR